MLRNQFSLLKALFAFIAAIVFVSCQDEAIIAPIVQDDVTTSTQSTSCGCTYTVPATANLVDAKALNIKPGAVICLNASYKYKNIHFKNLTGTSSNPIVIRNCGGTAVLNGTGMSYGVKFDNCKYFRFTGGGTTGQYGIKITSGHIGLSAEYLSTNFEIDHVEASGAGFAGFMAKTDPTCDAATWRGNFTMYNVSIHDNYVHNTGGEGMYIGNSFYDSGVKTSCGTKYPHEIHSVKIFNNRVAYSGWESIQVGCATVGADIHDNTIENYGTKNVTSQNNGVQIGVGTGGKFYKKFINKGTGNGLIVLGIADNLIHDNIIANAGAHAIFCDDRVTTGTGFKFFNNTLINPKLDGIRLYADHVEMNVVINNIIVNPGSYTTYTYPRKSQDAYIYKLSSSVKVQASNNYLTRIISNLKFVNATGNNFRLTSSSPAVNKGKSISTYNVAKDYYESSRLKGSAYDIGASEY